VILLGFFDIANDLQMRLFFLMCSCCNIKCDWVYKVSQRYEYSIANLLPPDPPWSVAADHQLQVLDPYPIYLLERIRLAAGEAVVVFVSIQIDYLFKSYMTMCQTCENVWIWWTLSTGSVHVICIHLTCQSDPQLVLSTVQVSSHIMWEHLICTCRKIIRFVEQTNFSMGLYRPYF